MSRRPDLVDAWIFREAGDAIEILLLRRSPGRILPGLWQCVSGSLEPGEPVVAGALRELAEETGIEGAAAEGGSIEALYHLDQVNEFFEPTTGSLLSAAVFAVRIGPGVDARLSHEHDAQRWLSPAEALELAVWPAYRESIRRIVEDLADPARATWFELHLDGSRVRV